MKMRKMRMADLPALARMNAEAFGDISVPQVRSFLSGAYAHRVDGACLVAEEKGKLIGAIICSRKITLNAISAEIPSLFVSKGYRGKGIGKALLNLCIRKIRGKRIRSAIIPVRANDKRAISLYEKAGFKPFRLMLLRRF